MQKQKLIKTITGTYTVLLADCGSTIRCNSASPFTITLPAATSFPNFEIDIVNVGAGAVTCNGVTLLSGNGMQLYSDKIAWTNLKILNSIAISDIPVMTSAEFATKISDETGTGLVVFSATPTLTYPKFGDVAGGNYTQVESDGTLVFNGNATVWNDSMIPAADFRTGGTALTFIDCGNGIFLYRFDVGDILYLQIQLPHDMKENTVIYPHLHLMTNTAIGATGYNVEVTTSQAWANMESVFPIPTVVSTGLVHSFQNKAQYFHSIMHLSSITPVTGQGGISSYVIYKIERITSSVQPLSPATSLFVLGCDIHYQVDSVGSRTISSK